MSAWLNRLHGFLRASHTSEKSGSGDSHRATVDGDDSPALERDVATVAGHHSLQSRVNRTLAMLFFGGLCAGLLTWYYGRLLSQPDTARRSAESRAASRATGDSPLPALRWAALTSSRSTDTAQRESGATKATAANNAKDRYAIGSILGPAPTGLGAGSEDTLTLIDSAPASSSAARTTGARRTPEQQLQDRLLGGAVFSHATAIAVPRDAAIPATPLWAVAGQGNNTSDSNALSQRLHSVTTPAVRASMIPTQRLLLPKGAFLDCTLETAIDSSLPGLTTCLTAVDTFSADGSVVLLERGTKLIGETQGDAEQGRSRIFVLWTEARTPTGVIVPLDSPGTDELGRSGLAGRTNRHFWERFGSAMLVTVIDGAIQSAVNRSNNGGVIINPAATRDVGTEVLRSTINIPPTINKRNGDRIQILVARDLDFRSVYELRAK